MQKLSYSNFFSFASSSSCSAASALASFHFHDKTDGRSDTRKKARLKRTQVYLTCGICRLLFFQENYKRKHERQRAINVMTFSVSGYFYIAPNGMNFNALHSNYTNCRALSISTIRKYLFGFFLLESHIVGVVRQSYGKHIEYHFYVVFTDLD